MEASEITTVLARASELQAKIEGAIRRASRAEEAAAADHTFLQEEEEAAGDDDDGEEDRHGSHRAFPDVQKLRAIRDALLDLQDHLDCLQALQKQQKFEREDLLVELEESRKVLIRRLREYNGTEWEIVQEAHAFVREPVQRKDDLMLPPYQSPVGDIPAFGERRSSVSFSKHSVVTTRENLSRRTSLASRPEDEAATHDEPKQSEEAHQQNIVRASTKSRNFSGLRLGLARLATRAGKAVSLSAKTALVLASVIAIFTLSQLEPQLRKWSAEKALKMQSRENGSRRQGNRSPSSSTSGRPLVQDEFCPPGKVLLVQDGVQKCFVKERVEAPFEEVIKQPDASYGYG